MLQTSWVSLVLTFPIIFDVGRSVDVFSYGSVGVKPVNDSQWCICPFSGCDWRNDNSISAVYVSLTVR